MKNLEKFEVISLNTEEQISIEGGGPIGEGIGYAFGLTFGVALKTIRLVAQNLGSFSV